MKMGPAVKRVSFKEHSESANAISRKEKSRKDKKGKNDFSPLDFHPKPHPRIRVPSNLTKFMEWLTLLDPVPVKCTEYSIADKPLGRTFSRYSRFSRKRPVGYLKTPPTNATLQSYISRPYSAQTVRTQLPKPRSDISDSPTELVTPSKGRWWFLNDVFATITYPMVLWEMRRLMGVWAKQMKLAETRERASHQPPPLDPAFVPESYHVRGDQWPEQKVRLTEFNVVIQETPTIILFIQDSSAAVAGSDKAEQFNQSNEIYRLNLKKDKESFHKSTQVPTSIQLNKRCGVDRPTLANKQTSVFISDILDATPVESPKVTKPITKQTNFKGRGKFMKLKEDPHVVDDIFNSVKDDNEGNELDEAVRMVKLLRSSEFTTIARMMGRAIERKLNTEKLVLFKKGEPPDSEARKVNILYTIKFMWTMKYPRNSCRLPVTCSCLNRSNGMLLAVGHGPFFLDLPEDKVGRVHIWNLRNNTIPEKVIKFSSCVTSVSFSNTHPFALLVGVLKGFVNIYDVSKNTPTLLVSTEDQLNSELLFEAKWFKDCHDGSEFVVTCRDTGTVLRYTKKDFQPIQLIDVTRREGFLVGVPIPDDEPCKVKCAIHYKPAVNTIAQHPQNLGMFLIGTEEGCVQKCSLETSSYLDVFQAHFGPIHKIKFHPVVPRVFLTVGIDYVVRIWAEGIYEPLLILGAEDDESWHEEMYEDADWSPTHPQIIVTINGPLAKIWDLRRFRREPWSTVRNPRGTRFTQVLFHEAGFQITIGDENGDVHVYTLSDLPFAPDPANASEVFVSCVRRVLLGNHAMLEKLSKLGYPFSEKRTIDEELNES